MPALTAEQVYVYARQAGFPPSTAVKMTAIAEKESRGITDLYNGKDPDDSYGLWQINMIDKPGYMLGQQRLAQFGLTSKQQLLDPATNARAAYLIWAGNDSNLSHWGIYQEPEKSKYEGWLPVAQQAALTVEGSMTGDGAVTGGWFADMGSGLDLNSLFGNESRYGSILIVSLLIGVLTAVFWKRD